METAKTFREQAEKYLAEIASDVRPATLHVYRSILDARLIPAIGGDDLSSIGNATAKSLVLALQKAGLSPATIRLAVTLMKQVLASAVVESGPNAGDALYQRQWNAKFIKAPKVSDQRVPVCALEGAGAAVACSTGQIAALIALLGGTGLRVGEALAVRVQKGAGNVWDPVGATITVTSTETPSGLQDEPKTRAGNRTVDLSKALNDFLCGLGRPEGEPLFTMSERTARRALAKLGIPGFHSLRRMRITYLEGISAPRMLVKYWAGHAAGDITERYTKVGSEIAQRKDWSERAGLGFQLA